MSDAVAMPVPRAWSHVFVGPWAVPASLLLVAAVSPFERPLPGAIFGFTLTTLELAIVAVLAAGAIAAIREPRAFSWRTPITIPAITVLASAVVASLAAPEFTGNALRFSGRLAAALLLFTVVANGSANERFARQLIATLLGAGAIVGAIAVLELAQVPLILDALKVFRPGFHVVGGQLRATSTLFYPTITSMYLEVVFALGLLWIVRPTAQSSRGGGPTSSRLAFAALILVGAGIIATFTRAGLIAMAISLITFGVLLYMKRQRWQREHSALAMLAVILAALVMVSRSPQLLITRMSTEGSQDWYGASYDVPRTLTLGPDSFNDIPVTLSNRGWLTWQSSELPLFALSYHWLSAETEEVVIYDGLRTPFAQAVAPGDDVQLRARVRAPGYPGTYLLVWDVVQEHRTWLSLEGVFPGRTTVTVEGTPVGAPLPGRGRMPGGTMRMPRPVLWQTALQVSGDHPLVGIGPDNFRHTYGRYLGLAAWDTRVHANNTYLEVLVGMGVLGLAALGWLVVAAARSAASLVTGATAKSMPLIAAAFAACTVIAAHGVVDSFLTFTSTYVVFAIAAGLLYRHAHRV